MHSACIFNSRAHMRGCRSGGTRPTWGSALSPPSAAQSRGRGAGGGGGVTPQPHAALVNLLAGGGGGVFLPFSSSFLPLITTCQAAGDGGTRGGPPLPALAQENRPPWAASRQRRCGSPSLPAPALADGRSLWAGGTVLGCPLCSGCPESPGGAAMAPGADVPLACAHPGWG